MNVLKYHAKQKELNAQDLSHITGMNYHKVCRLLRQDQHHIETQLQASLEIVKLFECLGLQELTQSIKKEMGNANL